jgi:hypothetical protein
MAQIGENCDPGSGICSALPHEAYKPVLGEAQAIKAVAGKEMSPRRAQTEIAPGTIAKSPFMKSVGQYAGPKNSAGSGFSGYLRAAARRLQNKALPLTQMINPMR